MIDIKSYFFRKFKRYIYLQVILLSILSLISSAASIFFAIYSRFAIDYAIAQNLELFWRYAGILMLIIGSQIVVAALNHFLSNLFASKLYLRLSQDVFHQLLHSSYESVKQYHSEDITNHFKTDLKSISDRTIRLFPSLIFNIGRFSGAFVVLFFIDYTFALLFLGLGTLLLIGSRLLQNPLKKVNNDLLDATFDKETHINETFVHLDIIKTYDSKISSDHFDTKSLNVYKKTLRKEKYYVLTQFGITLFYGFGFVFAIIFGAYRVATGVISIGELTSIVQLVQNIQNPFRGFSGILGNFVELRTALARMTPLIELEKDDEPINLSNFDLIEIKDLSFAYEDDQDVLSNINLSINKQDIIHIDAASGKGKTTLFRLLLGLYKTDAIDVVYQEKHYPYYQVNKSLISYVPQASFLLKGTILDNLTLGIKYPNEKIINACIKAHIYDDIMTYPNGFYQELGEGGKGLSLGQSQRIAIARAILKDAPILILDEIGASLDANTEKIIYTNLLKLNKTLLVASHKPLDIPYTKYLTL